MNQEFPAATSAPTFYRTYSRRVEGNRENYADVTERTSQGLAKVGKFNADEFALVADMMEQKITLPSGRWMWVGGTEWIENPENFYSAYNCNSTNINDLESFGLMMSLGMMGCGTGAVLEDRYISQLPPVRNSLQVRVIGEPGQHAVRLDKTYVEAYGTEIGLEVEVVVGDSRQGWVDSMMTVLKLAFEDLLTYGETSNHVNISVDISSVRPDGTPIKGFGGVANPIKLSRLYERVAAVLNRYVGRQLDAEGVCLLLDEPALTIVAGNVRRYAGMRQFDSDAPLLKENLWVQDADGTWRIDPERDALRMSNHTRVYHYKPSLQECVEAVRKQFYSGEGAIQWAGEAVARANADLLDNGNKSIFLRAYELSPQIAKTNLQAFAKQKGLELSDAELEHRMSRVGLNPCFRGDMRLLTVDGYKTFEELEDTEPLIINAFGNVSQSKVWCSGEKGIVYLNLTTQERIYCTADHVFLTTEGQFMASQCKQKQLVPYLKNPEHNVEFKVLGFIQGDGQLSQSAFTKGCLGVVVNIGKDDTDILSLIEANNYEFNWQGDRHIYLYGFNEQLHSLDFHFVQLPERKLPGTYSDWNKSEKAAFLNGLYSANGSVIAGGRISFKTTSFVLVEQLLGSLCEDFGIDAYYTTNKPKMIEFANGVYQCRESYDVNIQKYEHRCTFFNEIGFSIQYKTEKLACHLTNNAPKVRSVNPAGTAKVYDFTEPLEHWGVVEGFVAHNCGEILGKDFLCDLSEIHLNQINPLDLAQQKLAFEAGALSVAALLHHVFPDERYRISRELDPIVGVSFTGLFDFFVQAFGSDWLRWWAEGRPEKWYIPADDYGRIDKIAKLLGINEDDEVYSEENDFNEGLLYCDLERRYLSYWKEYVRVKLFDYCNKHNLKRPNRYTTVQPAGCLDKNALRIFDQGLLYADELMNPGSGEFKCLELSVRGGIQVNQGIANQPLKLVKITLANGRVLRMTPNHRLSVQGDWVFASEMIPGMQLDFKLGTYRNETEFSFSDKPFNTEKQSKFGRSANKINTPKNVSPELAYFLGMLYGDGSMSLGKHRVRFCSGNENILQKLSQIGESLFGLKGTLHPDSRGGRSELCFASQPLFAWMEYHSLGKSVKSAYLDRIPKALRQSSRNSILAFFSGMIDSDGAIEERGCVRITSASENFLRNLQQIGESVGLSFSINHETKGENFQLTCSMWVLNLSRMTSEWESIEKLNQMSVKAAKYPIPYPKRQFKFNPYQVEKIEFESVPDYSYDVAVEGVDDDDSWYWQGAIKSHNTKSLLTGASAGWHPPKAQRYIRRITFTSHDPVALACMDYGYSVLPSQSCKDDEGRLLDDPFDPRVTEWLVEIPVEVSWANLPGADQIDISKFSAEAQFSFYMQVQKYYAGHNVSATIELREHEIETVGNLIYNAIADDEGYISCALLARFDANETYPRLPFEPISKERYDKLQRQVLSRRQSEDFQGLLEKYDRGWNKDQGVVGCDSDKCMMPEAK